MRAVITGGCGFIGSALVRCLIGEGHVVFNIDKLTYAGDPRTVADVAEDSRYHFRHLDIGNADGVRAAIDEARPDVIFHLAAESHVDRSIDDPGAFIDTNVRGSFVLLQEALNYWQRLDGGNKVSFRFVQVSTDEVFGSLGDTGRFSETSAYQPNSPYSASKAAGDHLARAWFYTYGLPTIISNCSNNYGPFQNREKLIPTIIRKALLSQPIPIYGQGCNVRDWLYVEDHVTALLASAARGVPGSTYAFGGDSEVANLDLARMICDRLDATKPRADGKSHSERIQFVTDRPGHDYRYSIDSRNARQALGWQPSETLTSGLERTIAWYIDHPEWTLDINQDGDRLGLRVEHAAR